MLDEMTPDGSVPTPTSDEIDMVASRIFGAIEAGDAELIESLWSDDLTVWHNTDRLEQTKEQNLRTLDWMVANTQWRSYVDIRRHCTPSGFTQQHVLHLGFADGRTAELPAALFVEVHGGQVTRIDEYLDTAQVAAAFPLG